MYGLGLGSRTLILTLTLTLTLVPEAGWYWPNQFESEANAWIHRQTTGPEIVQAFEGERLDWFVTAYGTGGTLQGVAQVLREKRPETKVLRREPNPNPNPNHNPNPNPNPNANTGRCSCASRATRRCC